MCPTVEKDCFFRGFFCRGGGDRFVGWGGDMKLGNWPVIFKGEDREEDFGGEVERLVGDGGCSGGSGGDGDGAPEDSSRWRGHEDYYPFR